MTEHVLKMLYQIKKENDYKTRQEIIANIFPEEMEQLVKDTKETYENIWYSVMKTFMQTKTEVNQELRIVDIREYKHVKKNVHYDDKGLGYFHLNSLYNKNICSTSIDGCKYYFSLEDLITKLTEDGFNVDYISYARVGTLNLTISANQIDEYLDKATKHMILKREV